MALTHAFTSAIADGADATLVRPSNWNADHAVSGTSLQVLFNNATSLTGMAGTSWDNTNRSLTLTGATVTTSNPVLNLSQTWNAGAVAFKGILLNVTNTASAATAYLIDLQVGGGSKFSVDTAGSIQNISNIATAGSTLGIYVGGAGIAATLSTGFVTQLGDHLGWSGAGWSLQTLLYSDTAGEISQRNGTSAQTLRVYNTYTDASNYERGVFDWTTTANTLTIGTQAAGTGTSRSVAFVGAAFSFNAPVKLQGYTVSTLPAAGTAGRRAYVTDATAPTYNGTLTGGGAVVVPVFDNGSAWVSA